MALAASCADQALEIMETGAATIDTRLSWIERQPEQIPEPKVTDGSRFDRNGVAPVLVLNRTFRSAPHF